MLRLLVGAWCVDTFSPDGKLGFVFPAEVWCRRRSYWGGLVISTVSDCLGWEQDLFLLNVVWECNIFTVLSEFGEGFGLITVLCNCLNIGPFEIEAKTLGCTYPFINIDPSILNRAINIPKREYDILPGFRYCLHSLAFAIMTLSILGFWPLSSSVPGSTARTLRLGSSVRQSVS